MIPHYPWHGSKYFLDEDVAALLGIETRELNRRLRTNEARFRSYTRTLPSVDFRRQNAIRTEHGGRRHSALFLTAEGLLMAIGLALDQHGKPATRFWKLFRKAVDARDRSLRNSIAPVAEARRAALGLIEGWYHFGKRRGRIDSEVALQLGLTTGALNQNIKRHRASYSQDMVFSLSKKELAEFKSNDGHTASNGRAQSPMFFTEEGILRASLLARTPKAIAFSRDVLKSMARELRTKRKVVRVFRDREKF